MPIAPAHYIKEKAKHDKHYDQKLNDVLALLYELLVNGLVLFVVSVTVLPERVVEDWVDHSSNVDVDVDQPCLRAQTELYFFQLVGVLSVGPECFLENHLQESESPDYGQRLFLWLAFALLRRAFRLIIDLSLSLGGLNLLLLLNENRLRNITTLVPSQLW